MRTVIQRVSQASVTIDGNMKSEIGKGLLVLLGICDDDNEEDIDWLVRKIVQLRVFDDENGVMNRSVTDIQGEIMVVSQFTLYASYKKGNRPSWLRASKPEVATPLYLLFCKKMSKTRNSMEPRNITLKEAQRQVDEWIRTYGVRYFSELTNMACLTEEVGELARVMARKYGDQSFKNGEKEQLGEEMADILWVLICLANQTGVDLTEEFQKTMEKKTRRDSLRHISNPKLKA